MGNVCGKGGFRKAMLATKDMVQNKFPTFRKNIEARISTPLKESFLERTPQCDVYHKRTMS